MSERAEVLHPVGIFRVTTYSPILFSSVMITDDE